MGKKKGDVPLPVTKVLHQSTLKSFAENSRKIRCEKAVFSKKIALFDLICQTLMIFLRITKSYNNGHDTVTVSYHRKKSFCK